MVLDPSDQGGNLLISNFFAVLGLIAVFAEYSKQNACSLLVVPRFESGILRLRTVQCCKRFIFMLVTERRPMAGEHCGLRPPDELVGLALAFCLLSFPSLPRYLLASFLGLARLLFVSTRLRALALTCSLRALARPLFLAEFFLLLSDLLLAALTGFGNEPVQCGIFGRRLQRHPDLFQLLRRVLWEALSDLLDVLIRGVRICCQVGDFSSSSAEGSCRLY